MVPGKDNQIQSTTRTVLNGRHERTELKTTHRDSSRCYDSFQIICGVHNSFNNDSSMYVSHGELAHFEYAQAHLRSENVVELCIFEYIAVLVPHKSTYILSDFSL